MKLDRSVIAQVVNHAGHKPANGFPDLVEEPDFDFKVLAGGFSRHTVGLDIPEDSVEAEDTVMITLPNEEGNRQFVLTLGNSARSAKVAEHCTQIKEFVAQNDVPMARHVTGPEYIEGTNLVYTVAEMVQGEHLFFPSSDQIKALGEAFGRMHEMDVNEMPFVEKGREGWREAASKVKKHVKVVTDRLGNKEDSDRWSNVMPAVRGLLSERMGSTDYSDLPAGCIHGDVHTGNVMFSEDGVEALLDFESSKVGPLVQDLSLLLYYYCVDEKGSLDPEKSQAFFETYNKHRQITQEEVEALPQMLETLASEKSTALWFLFYDKEGYPELSQRTDHLAEQMKDFDPYELVGKSKDELPSHTESLVTARSGSAIERVRAQAQARNEAAAER